MANPSGDDQEAAARAQSSSFNPASSSGGHGYPSPESGSSVMKHNPEISLDWSAQEQGLLEEGLRRHVLESSINRYAKIAMMLPNKTVRDVAFRCRWMAKKETSKRRKEERNPIRKGKEKKERIVDQQVNQGHFRVEPNVPPFLSPVEHDDGISYNAIGGVTGQLLEQNALAFSQIRANLATFQIHDNIALLRQTRENIYKIMNSLNSRAEVMQQMPPLSDKLNEELANAMLDF